MRWRPLLAILVATACHQQVSRSGHGIQRNVITQEEIEASTASNVYDLIAQTRADYLKDRGKVSIRTNQREQAVVFLNDQEYGILETMRNIPLGRVSEIRYYPGTEAVNRFGAQYGGGIVMLISRNN
jgi:outer membrane cobalamin receptor